MSDARISELLFELRVLRHLSADLEDIVLEIEPLIFAMMEANERSAAIIVFQQQNVRFVVPKIVVGCVLIFSLSFSSFYQRLLNLRRFLHWN